MHGILTNDPFGNTSLMIAFFHEHSVVGEIKEELSKISVLKLDACKNRHRISRLQGLFSSIQQTVKLQLIKFWLENILNSSAVESLFNSLNVNIPPLFLPRSVVAA